MDYLFEKLNYEIVTIGAKKVEELEPYINFLFIVHNEIEMNEMQRAMRPLQNFDVVLDYIEEECMQHFFIGRFFKYNIVLAKTSDMGSMNTNSVINIINRAIQIFRPRYIIMPGIAAGLADDIKIGDVVIANKVIGYESEKIAPVEVIGRYPEFRSPRLYNLFCSANTLAFNAYLKRSITKQMSAENIDLESENPDCKNNCPKYREIKSFTWSSMIDGNRFPMVFTGNYFSGEKLLDNQSYRQYLKTKFKEAKALEMEGVGVASASTFNRVYDWLLIKGISDLGDGNKGKNTLMRQIFAMKSVILVLKKVFDDENSFPLTNLKQVKGYNRKNVLVSGSQDLKGPFAYLTNSFMRELGKALIENNYNVLTGYGKMVGPPLIYGIFEGCGNLGLSTGEYMDRFQSFAFPRNDGEGCDSNVVNGFDNTNLEHCKIINRQILCANANIAIFVFGNKPSNFMDENMIADGMFREVELAQKNGALILPVGCTHGTARRILHKITNSEIHINYIKSYFVNRQKYHASSSDADEDFNAYMRKLDELDRFELSENNVYEVVQKIIEIINLFG